MSLAVSAPARLRALRNVGLLDAPREVAFDRLTRLAHRLVGGNAALFSLVDEDRQFFLSEVGLEEPTRSARETPLSHSFCQHVVARAAPLVVADAREDPLVASNGAVDDLGIIAYLGVPVVAPEGEVIGALCVLDGERREWDEADLEALMDLAAVGSAEIAARVAERDAAAALASTRAEGADRQTLLGLAVNASGYGLWSTDLKTGETFWDPRCREIFGVGPEVEATGELGQSLVHPDDRADAAQAFSDALADPSGAYRTEKRLIQPDGAVRWVLNVGQVLRDADGEPSRILGLAADVTGRRRDEASRREALEREVAARTEALNRQTQHAQRLASALTVAEQRERQRLAEILHEDLQQIIFGIGLHLGADRMAGYEQDPVLQDLVDRALRLTRSLSHELAVPGPFDGRLDRTLQWLADSVHDVYSLDVSVEAEESIYVSMDTRNVAVHLVREVLFNVAKHAGVSEATIRVWREPNLVAVEVADDGVGFDATSVDRGRPAGLGLRGVEGRLSMIGGACTVETMPGEGTRVTLRFPAGPRLLTAPEPSLG